jgi:hypothetical protein
MRTTLCLALLLIAAIVATSPAFAVDTDFENSVVGGTIPELCQLRIAGTTSALLTMAQDGEGEAAYDAGFINSATAATVLTLDANTAWVLSVNYSGTGWAANGTYTKANTDLLIKITNAPTGGDAGGYKAGFVSPPNLAGIDEMLSDAAAGVSNNVVHIQTKVLLSWADDIPGTYTTTLVYTLVADTP